MAQNDNKGNHNMNYLYGKSHSLILKCVLGPRKAADVHLPSVHVRDSKAHLHCCCSGNYVHYNRFQ